MASLRKPASCTKCDSTLFVHLFDPERWICRNCTSIEVERPQRNDPNKCRDCDAKRGDKPFKGKKNQCLECFNKYMKHWRETNPEHWRAWKLANKRRLGAAVRRAIQKTPQAFITALYGHLKTRVKCKSGKDLVKKGKLNPICLDVQIDYNYLWNLWEFQKWKCALTGLIMCHRFNDPMAISIDRKDSSKGYVPGNVQLVCQWVNKAKGNLPNNDFKYVLLKLQNDGCHLKCDLHLEADTVYNAFLCSVRDAIVDELWGEGGVRIIEYNGNLRVVLEDGYLDLRYYESDEKILLDLTWDRKRVRPVGWGCVGDPRPVVDMGDPGVPGKIVGLVRAGLVTV